MSWFVFVVRLSDDYTLAERDTLLYRMSENGIQVSNYFPPVHLQPFIAQELGCKEGDFPVTESICQRTIALPFYNNLTDDDIRLVCETLIKEVDSL